MEKLTYTEAFEELQRLVSEIERGEIRIDELSEKVKRAKVLIGICRAKLTETEADVNDLLEGISGNLSRIKTSDSDESNIEDGNAMGSTNSW